MPRSNWRAKLYLSKAGNNSEMGRSWGKIDATGDGRQCDWHYEQDTTADPESRDNMTGNAQAKSFAHLK